MGAPTLSTVTVAGSCILCGSILKQTSPLLTPRNALTTKFAEGMMNHLAQAHGVEKHGVQQGPYVEIANVLMMATQFFALSHVATEDPLLLKQREILADCLVQKIAEARQKPINALTKALS